MHTTMQVKKRANAPMMRYIIFVLFILFRIQNAVTQVVNSIISTLFSWSQYDLSYNNATMFDQIESLKTASNYSIGFNKIIVRD